MKKTTQTKKSDQFILDDSKLFVKPITMPRTKKTTPKPAPKKK